MLFALPGNEVLACDLARMLNIEVGEATVRRFPDGESYINVLSPVKAKHVILVCTLHKPDDKLLPLYFFSKTLKEFGASAITLVAPYLAYMRQDKRFHEGEAITSGLFASLMSSFIDRLITVDPHLHRRSSLDEIYSIPSMALHAAPLISEWIRNNISNALLVGPDGESEQWVSQAAKDANADYIVLQKSRLGDRDVQIIVPDVTQWVGHTPVLVDDIISTAKTMTVTTNYLLQAGYKAPVCIGVHGVFAENAYNDLIAAGAATIITTNSISHITNQISITNLLAGALLQ